MNKLQATGLLLALACLLSNCRCMVSSNLGAKLDSIGYARVEKHELVEKRPFYQLGDSKKSAYLDKLEFEGQ